MKYILVSWPEIQDFMMTERWDECIFCTEIEGHPCPDSTYAVPEDLFNEVYKELKSINNMVHLSYEIPNVPDGKIAVWENGRVVFKDKIDFPESWEDYCKYNNPGTILHMDSSISTGDENPKSTITFGVPNEKRESFIAFIKLFYLRDCYRQGWVPDDISYSNGEEKYCIWKNYDEKGYVKLVVDPIYSSVRFLTFQTHEIAKKFLCNFRELILEAEDLIF